MVSRTETKVEIREHRNLTAALRSTCTHALEGPAAASRLGNTEPKLRTLNWDFRFGHSANVESTQLGSAH